MTWSFYVQPLVNIIGTEDAMFTMQRLSYSELYLIYLGIEAKTVARTSVTSVFLE